MLKGVEKFVFRQMGKKTVSKKCNFLVSSKIIRQPQRARSAMITQHAWPGTGLVGLSCAAQGATVTVREILCSPDPPRFLCLTHVYFVAVSRSA